ncbi:MAG: multiheme c-type cytochrome [Coriobacteriia bacterium]|nr:multiheme c-type cytochrome [Coriobacteriia bacterium]
MARLRTGIASVLIFLAVISLPVLAYAVTAATTATAPEGSKAYETAEKMVTPSAVEPTKTASASAKPSAPVTQTYDLDFTLPTYGKSGCLVCHGDPNLAKIGVETTSSVYIDVEVLNASAHQTGETPCTGCHLDFAYTAPHKQTEGDWEMAARLACKNCHKDAFSAYANGIHSPAGKPGQAATQTAAAREAEGKPEFVPLCGDCHGGHMIPSMDDTAAMSALHLSGGQMCGSCHVEASESYDDYYHGAAYKRGSMDAPSCWDCHGYHEILAVDDRRSPVHESRLAETCGQTGCHENVDEQFLEYAPLTHGQATFKEEVAITQMRSRIFETIKRAWQDITGSE